MSGAEAVGEFGVWYVVFLLTLTIHEGAHALVARLGGDQLAYRSGQVSLNPWPHIRREPFGTVFMPILTFLASGWMMGWASTPYDPAWGRRHPRRLAAMSAAGPAANLLLALGAFVLLRGLLATGFFVAPRAVSFSHLVEPGAGTPPDSLAHALAFTLSVALNLNVLLGLFNLVPLPPLDGGGIVRGLFPDAIGRYFESLSVQPVFSLLGLLAAWRLFDLVYRPAFALLLRLLHPGVTYGS